MVHLGDFDLNSSVSADREWQDSPFRTRDRQAPQRLLSLGEKGEVCVHSTHQGDYFGPIPDVALNSFEYVVFVCGKSQ